MAFASLSKGNGSCLFLGNLLSFFHRKGQLSVFFHMDIYYYIYKHFVHLSFFLDSLRSLNSWVGWDVGQIFLVFFFFPQK